MTDEIHHRRTYISSECGAVPGTGFEPVGAFNVTGVMPGAGVPRGCRGYTG